jgi:predicted PurR-regulated permease PerM
MGRELVEAVKQLPTYRQNIRDKVDALASGQGYFGRAAENVKSIGEEISRAAGEAQPAPRRASPPPPREETSSVVYVRQFLERLLGPIALAGLVLVVTGFMIMEREDLRNRLLRLSGTRQLAAVTRALDESAARVSRYLLLLALMNLTFGAMVSAGVYLIGLPNPLLWGAVAALLRVIPYVGSLVAAGLPVFLAFAVFPGWTQPALVLGLVVALELVTGNVLEPLIYGTHTGISSLALLVAAVFWAVIWGAPGLVLSTPMTVCLAVVGRHIPALYFLHVLLGDQTPLTPQEQLYQRFLANDRAEAHRVGVAAFSGLSPAEACDTVLVPALQLARRDQDDDTLVAAEGEALYTGLREFVENLPCAEPGTQPEAALDRTFYIVPARDELDEVAGAMAASLLQHAGWQAHCLTRAITTRELLATLRGQIRAEDVIIISALAPASLESARRIGALLSRNGISNPVVMGVWSSTKRPAALHLQLACRTCDTVVTTYSSLAQWIEGVHSKETTTV